MKKTCLVLMLSGHEVRQFGHSGMISELLNRGMEVIVSSKIVDKDLVDQMDQRIKFFPLFQEQTSKKYHRIQIILDYLHEKKEEKIGKVKWIDEWKKPNLSLKKQINTVLLIVLNRFICNNNFVYKTLLKHENYLRRKENPEEWIKFLQQNNVNVIVSNTPRSELLQPALIAAEKLSIPCVLFYHSIKDTSTKGRINHPYNSIGVWNRWMKDEIIRQNPDMCDDKNVLITGCAHFDCVGQKKMLLSEVDFREEIRANKLSKLLLYPAAVNWVLPDQGKYVFMIIKAINDGRLPKNIQIVIRTNPMDNSNYFEEMFNGNPYVVIQKSDWRREKDSGWNFQRRKDLYLFNSLLHYSSLSFGIPSTITTECAISELPVINIGFDLADPRPPRSMISFWNAEFYQQEVRHNMAYLCTTEEDLIRQIREILSHKKSKTKDEYNDYFSEFLGVPPHKSAHEYVKIIENSIFPPIND